MTNDPSSQPTQPLTDERLAAIHGRFQEVINDRKHKKHLRATDMYDLLNEVDRLRTEVAEARGEAEFHHTWDGLMALVEQHYPEEIFPTVAGPDRRDPGPRIVSLVRWVDQLRAENATAHQKGWEDALKAAGYTLVDSRRPADLGLDQDGSEA